MDIATPEGVDLEVELGGLGSRFVADLLDTLLKALVIVAVALLLRAVGSGLATAALLVLSFVIWYGYDVLFEVLANGRTPGKRGVGLRVVRTSGQPVGLVASAIRNLVRIVDGPATSYIVGVVAITVSKRNQRLGDMAADTLVVREAAGPRKPGRRERRAAQDAPPAPPAPPPPAGSNRDAQWDVSAVTQEEIAAVRQFLDRRDSLDPAARRRLGEQLAEGLRPKLAGVPPEVRGEQLLLRLSAAKAARL